MSKKKKVNPRNRPLSQADMKFAEKKWQEQLQDMKNQATSDASLFVMLIMFKALINTFHMTLEEMEVLQDEIAVLGDRIADPDDEYEIGIIKQELIDFGMNIETEWE